MSRSRDIADFVTEITDGTDTVETGYVINGSAKAWGAADMSTTALRTNNFNVSSLTDNGTGQPRFNLTNAMSDADYVVVGSTSAYDYSAIPITSSQMQSAGVNSTGNFYDWSSHQAVALGDLA